MTRWSALSRTRFDSLGEILIAAAALRVFALISDANFCRSRVSAGARASEAMKKISATVAAHFHSDGLLRTWSSPAPSPPFVATLGLRLDRGMGNAIKAFIGRAVIISLDA
jgi:hypothetical protein